MFIKNYFNFIKKNGLSSFIINGKNEIRKKIFCVKEKILFKGKGNSYSQYCEDLFIIRKLKYKKNINYIDIGANDPDLYNNTKKIYEEYKGKGVNIDANPILIEGFKKKRVNDINLNIGIGKTGILPFYISYEDTLSSFSDEVKKNLNIKETLNIEVFKLKDIFNKFNLSLDIDLLSIDVEGWSIEVLKSNNWKYFRPKIICIENDEEGNNKLDNFLIDKNYKKIGYNGLNNFFIDIINK